MNDQATIESIICRRMHGLYLSRLGKVAFKGMTSRDFDLISAEPTLNFDEVLPELLGRYFSAYGSATLADAAYYFGISKEDAKSWKTCRLTTSAVWTLAAGRTITANLSI